jgi:transcription-repair coupling factor (superfamily II helicase)
VSQVVSPGEYAVRGGLIDLFPMGSAVPYRVDLFGDEVDSIRTFDPDSQRSLYPVPEVRLLPGREFPMDEDARTGFRSRWRERIDGDPTKIRLYKDIGAGIATAGIEYYLPLFFDETSTVFDYLGRDATVALHGELDEALKRFWSDTRERHPVPPARSRKADPAAGDAVPEAGRVLRPARDARGSLRCEGRVRRSTRPEHRLELEKRRISQKTRRPHQGPPRSSIACPT